MTRIFALLGSFQSDRPVDTRVLCCSPGLCKHVVPAARSMRQKYSKSSVAGWFERLFSIVHRLSWSVVEIPHCVHKHAETIYTQVQGCLTCQHMNIHALRIYLHACNPMHVIQNGEIDCFLTSTFSGVDQVRREIEPQWDPVGHQPLTQLTHTHTA